MSPFQLLMAQLLVSIRSIIPNNDYDLFNYHLIAYLAPGDYTPFTGLPVVFVTAPSQECVNIDIVDDNIEESNELFEVVIDNPQFDDAISLGVIDRTTVVIMNDGELNYSKIRISIIYHVYRFHLLHYTTDIPGT